MLYTPTTLIMAADAQRRHVAAARLDGYSTAGKRSASRGLTATLFRRQQQVAGRGLAGRRFTAAPTAS